METQSQNPYECQAHVAPVTSKLLGNPTTAIQKLFIDDCFQKSANFQYNNVMCIKPVNGLKVTTDSSESAPSIHILTQHQQQVQQQAASVDNHLIRHVNKTTKLALFIKLPKEEMKQVEVGDTSVLQAIFKNMTSGTLLAAENFKIITEKQLPTIVEKIQATAAVPTIEYDGAKMYGKQIDFPLGMWSTPKDFNGQTQVRKQRYLDEHFIENDERHRKSKYFFTYGNAPYYSHKSTQYETQEISSKRTTKCKAVQCDLINEDLRKRITSEESHSKKESSTATEIIDRKIVTVKISDETKVEKGNIFSNRIIIPCNEPKDSLLIIREKFTKKSDDTTDLLKKAPKSKNSSSPNDTQELPIIHENVFSDQPSNVCTEKNSKCEIEGETAQAKASVSKDFKVHSTSAEKLKEVSSTHSVHHVQFAEDLKLIEVGLNSNKILEGGKQSSRISKIPTPIKRNHVTLSKSIENERMKRATLQEKLKKSFKPTKDCETAPTSKPQAKNCRNMKSLRQKIQTTSVKPVDSLHSSKSSNQSLKHSKIPISSIKNLCSTSHHKAIANDPKLQKKATPTPTPTPTSTSTPALTFDPKSQKISSHNSSKKSNDQVKETSPKNPLNYHQKKQQLIELIVRGIEREIQNTKF